MPQTPDDFAARLDRLIKQYYGTHEALGKVLGLRQDTVSKWIRRERKPGIEYVKLIADKTGVTMDWLAARDQIVAGISIDRVVNLLLLIDRHQTWGKQSITAKLRKLADIYDSSMEQKTLRVRQG